MYFDPVTGAPAAMPQIQFPTSQTAATPVEGGFTVGDYAKKKRIAEALRAKTGQGYSQMDPVGFVEGSGGQPGQAYINYGNIISNAMQPWLEGRREEKAAAAEDEAAAARQQALDQLLGKESISKADALRAQEELGVDASILLPEEMNMAAQAQASNSKSGLRAMMRMGVISPEEYEIEAKRLDDEAAAQIQAKREQYLFEQGNKVFSPTAGSTKPSAEEAKFNLWLTANPGKNYNDYLAATKSGGRTVPVGKTQTSADTSAGVEAAQRFLDLANDPKTFAWNNRLGKVLKDSGSSPSDGVLSGLASGIATATGAAFENEQALLMNKAAMDNVIAQAKNLYPVSNSDMMALRNSMPTSYNDQKAVQEFAKKYLELAKKADTNMRLLEQGKLPENFDYATDGPAQTQPTVTPSPSAEDTFAEWKRSRSAN